MHSFNSMNIILEEDPIHGHKALWLGNYTAAVDLNNLKLKGIKTVLCVASGIDIKYATNSGINQIVYGFISLKDL